jgi:hypothetical protein
MMEAKGDLMKHPKYWILVLFLLILACARKQPTVSIYNEKADAHRDIAAAMANAKGSKRNVVLIFGANW